VYDARAGLPGRREGGAVHHPPARHLHPQPSNQEPHPAWLGRGRPGLGQPRVCYLTWGFPRKFELITQHSGRKMAVTKRIISAKQAHINLNQPYSSTTEVKTQVRQWLYASRTSNRSTGTLWPLFRSVFLPAQVLLFAGMLFEIGSSSLGLP
jgi:hypothetical protein